MNLYIHVSRPRLTGTDNMKFYSIHYRNKRFTQEKLRDATDTEEPEMSEGENTVEREVENKTKLW